MKGFTQLTLAAFATYASARSINLNKRESPLDVRLSPLGNTEVKVAVTNNGDKTLNLLTKGTFLDEENPVEKVSVYSTESDMRGASVQIPFEGIKIRLLTTGLLSEDFITLGAGETKEVTVDTASLHTFNDGGDFDVYAHGRIPYAEANSTELAGTLQYDSNKLSMTVDGELAATVAKAITKRTMGGNSCSGDRLSVITTAVGNCAALASSAAGAASAGTKLDTYFKSSSYETMNTVSARLSAVANDCGGGSATTTECSDVYQGCAANVLAYTVPSQNIIAYCDIFFSELPALAQTCHAQDQATTMLHEETHAPAVFSPGTDDLGYGFAAASGLSAEQALINADSYALYANAIKLNC